MAQEKPNPKDNNYLEEWETIISSEQAQREETVNRALDKKGEYGAPLVDRRSQRMPELEITTSADMLRVLAEQQGLEMADISQFKVDVKLLPYLPADLAREYKVFPLTTDKEGNIVIAISDPLNVQVLDNLRFLFDNRSIKAVVCEEDDILDYIDKFYGVGGSETIEGLVEDLEKDGGAEMNIAGDLSEINLSDIESLANAVPVVKLANLLLIQAIKDRSSDLHIEPFSGTMRIRYRVDGVLREIPSPPKSLHLGLVSRFKVMAGMNISESRLPQDGRIRINLQNREIDLRVASLPTIHGESIVMRILDKSTMMLGIEQLGFTTEALEIFRKSIHKPNGIVLCTGPTGCGKTTTLYGALCEINDPGSKIITTEDPVEYEIPGIVQVNINTNVDLTFARCLRSILRQDPDIILVGEIRDTETARIAIQASLTGHLVLSTLHTNDAASTLTRLIDMGIEPFLLTSTIEMVVGQRLVRTICPSCKRPYVPTDEELGDFGTNKDDIKDIEFFKGLGCEDCFFTGYKGRIGIMEVLPINDDIRELILSKASADEIRMLGIHHGMQTMRQDGWFKICTGITSFEEVTRQTPKESIEDIEREMSVVLKKVETIKKLAKERAELEDQVLSAEQEPPVIQKQAVKSEPAPTPADEEMWRNEAGIQAFKIGDAQTPEK